MRFKYFTVIAAAFVTVLLISNVAATKVIGLGMWAVPGATLLFPFSYLFGDILTEVYGYSKSRMVIWMGFTANIFMVFIFWAVGALPASGGWENQAAYDSILGVVPRIVLASLVAFWIGEFLNSYVLAKMKVLTNGRHLWSRTIGSTIVGQAFDATIFVLIAFGGILPWSLVGKMIYTSYVVKVAVEVILTPVTYKVVNGLKNREHENYFDTNTNFNPFKVRLSDSSMEVPADPEGIITTIHKDAEVIVK